MNIYRGLVVFPHTWNNGKLEDWSLDVRYPLMNIFHFHAKPNVANIPPPHFPRTRFSIIPVSFGSQATRSPTHEGRIHNFQHSNCERSELICLKQTILNLVNRRTLSMSSEISLWSLLFIVHELSPNVAQGCLKGKKVNLRTVRRSLAAITLLFP